MRKFENIAGLILLMLVLYAFDLKGIKQQKEIQYIIELTKDIYSIDSLQTIRINKLDSIVKTINHVK